MYGVAWIAVTAIIVAVGLLLVAGITLAAPLFALLALIVLAIGAYAFFAGRRGRIGSERDRVRRGDIGPVSAGDSGAPAASEGSSARDDGEYEPAL